MSGAVHIDTTVPAVEAIRRLVHGADEVLLCSAFVHARGVNLVAPGLRRHPRARMVTTTAFGTTTADGIDAAAALGVGVRVLNLPGGATYHPKVYLARHRDRTRAVVGSANLTGGLVANIEAVVAMTGDSSAPPLAALWDAAESWWDRAVAPTDLAVSHRPTAEVFSTDLRHRISHVLGATDVVRTLTEHKPNEIVEAAPDGLWVRTARSVEPQFVPAWMIQVAWEHLRASGELTNRHLLADDGLNVKRSSFVCALLAAMPDVDVASTRPIRLRLRDVEAVLAAEDPVEYDS